MTQADDESDSCIVRTVISDLSVWLGVLTLGFMALRQTGIWMVSQDVVSVLGGVWVGFIVAHVGIYLFVEKHEVGDRIFE